MDQLSLNVAPVFAVVSFAIAAVLCRVLSARRAAQVARASAWIGIGSVIVSALLLFRQGAVRWPANAETWLGFATRIDPLNLLALGVVCFVGLVVVNYSRAYLDGNPRQHLFFGRLAATLAAVCLLVSSATIIQLLVGWVATSLTLHQLLLFYPNRPLAQLAARKKFWFARIGDLSLLGAAALLINQYATFDIATLNALASAGPESVNAAAALLIVVAALLKSAQFPLHGWLTEVMETPTPVSALLHAGIVNGGGYLVIRFADVVVSSEIALLALVIVGGTSAVVASVVMLTQTTVKGQLGYSTVAQMGFMMLQCGLGAFASAALHLVAHSFYKAHSFLASGNAVEQVRAWRMSRTDQASLALPQLLIAMAGALAIYAVIAALFGSVIRYPGGVFALGVVYIIGLFGFLARGIASRGIWLSVATRAALATVAYFSLQAGMLWYFRGQLPLAPVPGVLASAITVLLIALFAAAALLQFVTPGRNSPWIQKLYINARHGLFLNDYLNRIAGAYRRVAN